jgi:hypothetical protein
MWRPIPGYEGFYEVSSAGEVRSVDRLISRAGRCVRRKAMVIKPYMNPNGYMYVQLSKNGESRHFRLHRLVALAYLDKSNETDIVNHKNGRKWDCRASNLEWCTQSDNIQHAYDTGLEVVTWNKPVIRDDGVVFPSVTQAAIAVDGFASKVSACCSGSRQHHRGYSFSYYEGDVLCL